MIELRNDTPLNFQDISSEKFRVYRFADCEVRITAPCWLNVSDSGGHRILDELGMSHYVPTGWRHLSWVVKDGQPHFVR